MQNITAEQGVIINGITYVPKRNPSNYYIVRTYSAGVFAGEIVRREGQEVEMKNARRLWYWDGAASLSQLATCGVSKPNNCKFPIEINVTLLQVIEIIPCTEKAIKSIKEVPIWKE